MAERAVHVHLHHIVARSIDEVHRELYGVSLAAVEAAGDHRLDEVVLWSTSRGCTKSSSVRSVRILVPIVVAEHPQPREVICEADVAHAAAVTTVMSHREIGACGAGGRTIGPGAAGISRGESPLRLEMVLPDATGERVHAVAVLRHRFPSLIRERRRERHVAERARGVRVRDPPALAPKRARSARAVGDDRLVDQRVDDYAGRILTSPAVLPLYGTR